ncbi:ANK REP REGION domain-containing protein [Citrus sinensis]|nr:ANK REP REGION domain-containing protein [Citrus sinensis]
MEKRLFEAAQTGYVQKLQQLLEENPLILHASALASAGNPLHVASAYGHVDFVKEIINLRPDLAHEVNQDGFSPMHIASSIGHTGVVRELLKVEQKLCHLQGPEKNTPLHCAAIKGKVHVLSEMLSACPECIEDVTIQHDTALHLAIKNNQFEAITVLVNWIRGMKREEIFNMKDEQGNTVLHLATRKKQRKGNGLTALDLLLIFPSEAGDREVDEILRRAGAKRMRDVTPSESPSPESHDSRHDFVEYFKFKKGRDSPGETRSALLVVAALVATTSFQFGVNPPGGVWQDNYTPDKNNSTSIAFALFMFFNSLGFKLSIYMIIILTTKFPLQLGLQLCFLAMYFTYDTAVIATTPVGIRIFIIVTEAIIPALIPLTARWVRKCRKKVIERRKDP